MTTVAQQLHDISRKMSELERDLQSVKTTIDMLEAFLDETMDIKYYVPELKTKENPLPVKEAGVSVCAICNGEYKAT
jgi:prefoldin subunit 5